MNAHLFQDIIEKLLKLHNSKKYLTYDDIMDICDTIGVPLTYTETILTEIIDRGCKIFGHTPTAQELNTKKTTDNAFDSIDYAQIDYEALYDEVLKIDPDLKAIIHYARQIRPAQHGEATYIFQNQGSVCDYRKRLFDMNFRSVIKVAFQKYQSCDEELADLIQFGSIGLLISIDKYDVSSESPFASYANSWIFQTISRGIRYRKNGCYFPSYISDNLKEIERMADMHVCSKCSGTKLYCPNLIAEIQKRCEFDSDIAQMLLSYTQGTISYGAIAGDTYDYDQLDDSTDICKTKSEDFLMLKKSDDCNPYEIYCKVELKDQINHTLMHLSQREQEVIRYRFGFFDGREWTLEEVGELYGVTRERIRQIETNSIRKIRHPIRSKQLRDFWV